MTDHRLVPPDDDDNTGLTQPARQGEVPDWFTASEESEPTVIHPPVPPAEDVPPFVLPDEDPTVRATPAEQPAPVAVSASTPASALPGSAQPAEDSAEDDGESAIEGDSEYEDEPEGDLDSESEGESYADLADEEYEEEPERPAARRTPPVPAGTRRRRAATPAAPAVPPPGRGYACADVVTAIFLLLTVLSISITILLIANPRSPLNPLPVPTFPPILVLASPYPSDTPTSTPTPEPATPTFLATRTFTPTATNTATATPTITNTPVVGRSTAAGSTQAATARATVPQYTLSPFAFTIKPLRYTSNTTKDACQWQSIAGTVSDLAGKPIKGLAIRVMGSNGNIDEVHYSGTELRFGESGFEVFLGAIPREDKYTVQLLGRTGAPISDTISVDTRAGCAENVVVIAFVQNHAY